jgi:hypothetical protein
VPDAAITASAADPTSATAGPRDRRDLCGPRCLRGLRARGATALTGTAGTTGTASAVTAARSIRSASAASRRSSGSLRSSPLITGHSGPAWAAGSTSSATTAVRLASTPPSRSNGPCPSTAAYREAPRPHRSPGAPDSPPLARSGAMYEGEPISTPRVVVSSEVPAARAIPKSVSTTRSGAIRMLAGLTSRCAMPARCAARSAARIPRPTSAAPAGLSGPSSLIRSRSDR